MTARPLPQFKYHPDPVGTGSVEPSEVPCLVCGKVRGAIYAEPILAESDMDGQVCPWCVASGRAHDHHGAEFFEPAAVGGYGRWEEVPPEVVDEICYRTPGFSGWQRELWWTHCGDAAEFLGPMGRAELEKLPKELEQALQQEDELNDVEWRRRLSLLDRDHGPTAYVFRCRHCGTWGGYVDAVE